MHFMNAFVLNPQNEDGFSIHVKEETTIVKEAQMLTLENQLVGILIRKIA